MSLDKHYRFSWCGLRIDPYRIFLIYNITHPAQQHAIKKLLRAGESVKSLEQDIDEVILTLQRWKEMRKEESSPMVPLEPLPNRRAKDGECAD